VDVKGVTYYGSSAGWSVTLTLSGLNPAKSYSFATTANRNDATYTNRISRFTISSADAFVNSSTAGTTITNGGASTAFNTGYNTVTGYVVRWTGINPGSDGQIQIVAIPDNLTAQYKSYAFSVFQLVEVPEPASIVLMGLGVAALLRRRR
jgi:hypothetical protein